MENKAIIYLQSIATRLLKQKKNLHKPDNQEKNKLCFSCIMFGNNMWIKICDICDIVAYMY